MRRITKTFVALIAVVVVSSDAFGQSDDTSS